MSVVQLQVGAAFEIFSWGDLDADKAEKDSALGDVGCLEGLSVSNSAQAVTPSPKSGFLPPVDSFAALPPRNRGCAGDVASTSSRRNRGKAWLASLALGSLFSSAAWAQHVTTLSRPDLYATIDAIVASPPRSHRAVERLLGVQLSRSSTGAFDFYEAQGVALGNVTLSSVDYREPAHEERELGPLLVLTLEDGCFMQRDILPRYGFDAVRSPNGHGADELLYWTRRARGVELSFGFTSGAGDCLKNVVFDIHPENRVSQARR